VVLSCSAVSYITASGSYTFAPLGKILKSSLSSEIKAAEHSLSVLLLAFNFPQEKQKTHLFVDAVLLQCLVSKSQQEDN